MQKLNNKLNTRTINLRIFISIKIQFKVKSLKNFPSFHGPFFHLILLLLFIDSLNLPKQK